MVGWLVPFLLASTTTAVGFSSAQQLQYSQSVAPTRLLSSDNERIQPTQPCQGGYPNSFQNESENNRAQNSPQTPTVPAALPSSTTAESEQRLADRVFDLKNGRAPLDVDSLNTVMNRIGRELHFLSEKSRECLYDKVRSLTQLKRMREGLKNAYRDIYNLQFTLASYQEQLKEMQEYLKRNRGRIVVVDNKQLGEMFGMVKRLQAAAESMASGALSSLAKS